MRDSYWQHGSICEDYSSIACPVFLIGGFTDLYTDSVFRMLEHLKCPIRALIGPWSHEWPMDSSPGPRINHLKECLRWWDCHLKGLSTGIMDEPALRLFLRDGMCCKRVRLTVVRLNSNCHLVITFHNRITSTFFLTFDPDRLAKIHKRSWKKAL